MTYTELLQQKEWEEKCNIILQRDRYICQDCGYVGYHNNTFMEFDNITEADSFFGNDLFLGESLHSLMSIFEQKNEYCEQLKDIKTILQSTLYDKNIYDLRTFGHMSYRDHCNVLSAPTGFRLVTEQNLQGIDINMKRINKSVPSKYGNVLHRAYLLEFPLVVAGKVYVTIEHNLKLAIDYVPYFDDIICVTFSNKMIYLRHNHEKGLNIHHKYYIDGKKPWEYEDTALVTLCEDCHQKRHEKSVPCYRSLEMKDIRCNYFKCDRCDGRGYLPQYNHVEHGICFKCGGEGVAIN